MNLLLANQKHSANPGDDRMMSRSRREFLEQGYYDPLINQLASLSSEWIEKLSEQVSQILDIGCGEGYYTHHILSQLNEQTALANIAIAGIDISKEAIRMAAKRYKAIPFAVASSNQIPVANEQVDIAYSVFAPTFPEEIVRVLKPDGVYFNVRPGPNHLFALRQQVYDQPAPHDTKSQELPGLIHRQSIPLSYQIDVKQRDLMNLLAMTPYYWQASREKQAQIGELSHLQTQVDFVIDQYNRGEREQSPITD